MKILKVNPNNSAVQNFCDFIRNNHKGLGEMVEEENEYTDGEDEGDEDDEDEEDSDSEKESQPSVRSSSSSIVSITSSVASSKQPSSNQQLGS